MKCYYSHVRILSKEQVLLSVSMEIFPVPWGAEESHGIVQLCQLQLGEHKAREIYVWTPSSDRGQQWPNICTLH